MDTKKLLGLDKYFGPIVCAFLNIPKIFKKKRKLESYQNVLILKMTGLGDVILALPIIRELKKRGKKVFFLCSKGNAAVAKYQPDIDEVIIFEMKNEWMPHKFFPFISMLKKKKIDVCIDLTQSSYAPTIIGNMSGAKKRIGFYNKSRKLKNSLYTDTIPYNNNQHIVLSFFDLLKPLNIKKPNKMELFKPRYTSKDMRFINNFLKKNKLAGKKLIGAHVSGPIPSRRWPLEKWAKVMDYMINKGYTIIGTGAPQENEIISKVHSLISQDKNKFINTAGKFSLHQLFALMTKFRFFLANDGGPLHIATATGLPVLGIFGPETPIRYAPFNKKSFAIYKGHELKCSPCTKPYLGEWPDCKRPICLDLISVEEVIEAIKLIEKNAKKK